MTAKVTDISAFRLKKAISGERRVGLQDAFKVPEAPPEDAVSPGRTSTEPNELRSIVEWPQSTSASEFDREGDDEATVPSHKETNENFSPVRLSTESSDGGTTQMLRFEQSNQDLAERIERLKSSINRINALMDELRGGPESRKNQGPVPI